MKKPVIIDTPMNTGAFFSLAYASRQFDIRGITVSSYEDTAQVCCAAEILGLKTPVYSGADRPIIRKTISPLVGSEGYHDLSNVFSPLDCETISGKEYAWDIISIEAKKQEGALEIITLGSLTNLAVALLKFPDLVGQIARITVMGGSRFCGNCPHSPQSEFNFYYDPEAAHIVLNSGIPIIIADLNTCESVTWNSKHLEWFCGAVHGTGHLLRDFSAINTGHFSLNELVALALTDDFFEAQTMHLAVNVETDSDLARGKLVIEYDTAAMKLEPNATLFSFVDADALRERILSVFGVTIGV